MFIVLGFKQKSRLEFDGEQLDRNFVEKGIRVENFEVRAEKLFGSKLLDDEDKSPAKKSPSTERENNIEQDIIAPKTELSFQFPDRPGEMGEAVFLPENLSEDDRKLVDDGWRDHSFNQFISDHISLHRSLPDKRPESCKSIAVNSSQTMPETSIIMIFHNEAWSTLLRSVHSILDRSPENLIREIILVDDFSDMMHLKEALDDYMLSFPKVKIVRSPKRSGVVGARLLGVSHASAPVLLFLDSHIECTDGWLEPLLDRIARDPKTVVCPVIDVVEAKTFRYHYLENSVQVGGFDFSLNFKWVIQPQAGRTGYWEPKRTPTMAGGLFAIDKSYFQQLGMYDPGFDIWGAENLELSFKVWMCGGTLEIGEKKSALLMRFEKIFLFQFHARTLVTFSETNLLIRSVNRMKVLSASMQPLDIFSGCLA